MSDYIGRCTQHDKTTSWRRAVNEMQLKGNIRESTWRAMPVQQQEDFGMLFYQGPEYATITGPVIRERWNSNTDWLPEGTVVPTNVNVLEEQTKTVAEEMGLRKPEGKVN